VKERLDPEQEQRMPEGLYIHPLSIPLSIPLWPSLTPSSSPTRMHWKKSIFFFLIIKEKLHLEPHNRRGIDPKLFFKIKKLPQLALFHNDRCKR
jgi:hypothetical protein